MTVAVRPIVTVTVSRYACGAVWLAVSSDGRPRPGWRYRADQSVEAAEAVDSFRRNGATILEEAT